MIFLIHTYVSVASEKTVVLVGSFDPCDRFLKGSGLPRRKTKASMKPETVSNLVRMVTDLKEAAKSLPEDDRRAYESAKRSIVEARFQAETHDGNIRIL
jgi:hypothetical protein